MRKRSLAWNAFSLFGAHFIAKALSFGMILVLPRHVGDADLGGYFLAVAVTNLLGVLAELGMRDPLIRELHLRPERASQTLGAALTFRSAMSFVVLLGCGAVVGVNRYPSEVARLIFLFGLAEVLNGGAQLFSFVFRARERMELEAMGVVLERGLVVFVGGGVVVAGLGGMTLLGGVAFGAAALNLLVSGVIVQRRFFRVRFVAAREELLRLWGLMAPFALANVLGFLYFRLDMILLGRWSAKGAVAVAWYGIAYSWVMALTIFPGAVMGAAFPHLIREGSRRRNVLYTRAWKLMLSTGPGVAILSALTAEDLIALAYPRTIYPPGTVDAAFARLAWAGGLGFLSAIVSNTLRALNRRRTVVGLMGMTVLVNVLLNAWAIPRYDHVGAATALLFSEAFFVVGGTWALRRCVSWTEWGFLPKLVGGWGILAVFLTLTDSWALGFRCVGAAALYGGYLVGTRTLRRDDWTLNAPEEAP